jgi:hypothetical protein
VIYQHPLAYLLGLEGIALLGAFSGAYDRDFTVARLREVQALLDAVDEFGEGVEARPMTTQQGYTGWASTCDASSSSRSSGRSSTASRKGLRSTPPAAPAGIPRTSRRSATG